MIGNIVRRVLHMIREEEQEGADDDGGSHAKAQAEEEHQVGFWPGPLQPRCARLGGAGYAQRFKTSRQPRCFTCAGSCSRRSWG